MSIDSQSLRPNDSPAFSSTQEWQALAELLSSTEAGMIFLQNGLITRINTTLAAQLGFSERELVGRHVASLFPGYDTSAALSNNPLLSLVHQDGKIAHVALAHKEGKLKDFNLMVHRIDSLSDVRSTIWILQPAAPNHTVQTSPCLDIPPLLIRRLQAIAENFPDLICICDPDSRLRFVSPSIKEILGYRDDELIGRRGLDLIHREDRHHIVAAFKRVLRIDLPPLTDPATFRVRHRDKSWRVLAVLARNLSAKGSVSGLLLSGRDVTKQYLENQKRDEESKRRLHYVNQLFQTAQQAPSDTSQTLETILESAAKLVGVYQCAYWAVADGAQTVYCKGLYDDARQNFFSAPSTIASDSGFHGLLLKTARNGQPLGLNDTLEDIRAAGCREHFRAHNVRSVLLSPGGANGVLAFMHDRPHEWHKDEVTFAEHIARMIVFTMHNTAFGTRAKGQSTSVTALPTVEHFMFKNVHEFFPEILSQSTSLTVFLIDLDGINDIDISMGGAIRDQLLSAAALRLQNQVRNDDMLGLLDDQRFILIAKDVDDIQIANDIAQQIVESMRSPFLVQGREMEVTARVGIAQYPIDGNDLKSLIGKASARTEPTTQSGKSWRRLPIASTHAGNNSSLDSMLAGELYEALKNGELQHYYQPQIQLRTGTVCCVEAFLRWKHPRHGLLMPSHIMSIAEQSGLTHELNRWLLHDICNQFQAWRVQGLEYFNVALNLSAAQLMDPDFLPSLEQALAQTGMPSIRLEWEVTEDTVMQNDAMSAALLDRIMQKQIGLSIDGYGAGTLSLMQLKRFPVHKVKIDSSFIGGLPTHDDDCAITEAIISMAEPLGLDVVAKGVETAQQMEYLRSHGCDIAQGYYFTQPLAPQEFEKWLIHH